MRRERPEALKSQIFWALIAGTSAITAGIFGLNVAASGEAILGVGLGLMSSLPGGLGPAMGIGRNLVAGVGIYVASGGIGTKAVIVLTALAVIAGLLSLWDNTWKINEMFGCSF